MAIEPVQIGTNRNAPVGADAINLYNTDSAENLTFGQLLSAVCLRAGAQLEMQTVSKMNAMDKGSELIADLADYIERLAQNSLLNSEWAVIRAHLGGSYGLENLPPTITSYHDRVTALTAMKEKLDQLTQTSQEDMIDLQTMVNRRDLAFTTGANLAEAVLKTSKGTAEKF